MQRRTWSTTIVLLVAREDRVCSLDSSSDTAICWSRSNRLAQLKHPKRSVPLMGQLAEP